MDANQRVDPEVVLQNWRTRILNGFLAIVAVIVIVMTVVTVLDAFSRPGQWPVVLIDIVLCVVMVALGIFRGIDYRIRAWGTLLVPYIVGVTVLATFGLGGSGRIYMLAVPIAALILIGTRPGMVMSVVSVITLVAFAILADRGLLAHTLIRDRNSLLLADWLAEFSDTIGLLAIVMAVLILFYRFQESLIASERNTHAELVQAQKLLEEQNATLEQKVQERTRELQASYHSLEQRNAALGLLNSVSEAMTKTLDVKTLMQLVGDKIRAIFDVDSSMIMLLDRQTNLIHVPYEYDRNEGGYIDYVEPFPLGTGLSSKVITTGQPLIANTLEEEIANGAYFPPEIIAKGKGAYGESWLGVPILSSDQVLGLIALADNRPNVFNQNHMRLLQTLSSNLGAAIENARLFDEEKARVAELEVINSVQAGLVASQDMQGIYELVGEKIREIFDVQEVDIASYDAIGDLLTDCYSYENGDRTVLPAPVPSYGFRKHVIQSRQPLLVNADVEGMSLRYGNPTLSGADAKSCLFVPMFAGSDVVGVISLQNMDRENVFSESDVRLLQTLSSSMSVTLENARLFDESRRLLRETEQRNRELSIINTIQQRLASKLELQAIIDLFGDEVSRIYPPQERIANNYSVYIALYDPQTQMIRFPYLIDGAGERFSEPPTPLGPGLTSFVIRSGQPLVLKSADEQIDYGVINFTQINQAIGSQSWLGVPIRSSGQVIGVLSMQDQRQNLFSDADARLLSTLAASLGVALENARLFEEAQQRAAELAIINSVQAGLASKLDMQAIYELVGEKIRTTFDAQVVTIGIYDRDTQIVHGSYYFEDGRRMPDISVPAFGFRKYVLEHGLPLLLNDDMAGWMKEYANPILGGAQPKSAIFIPMMVGNEAIGVVSLQNNDQENAFSQSDIFLLTTLVNSMSVALENARLFDETQRLLKETENRNSELQIINAVQQGLAAELNFQAVVDLVGDKLCEIFNYPDLSIFWVDEDQKITSILYAMEHGKRWPGLPEPIHPGGLIDWLRKTKQPIVGNTQDVYQKFDIESFPGSDTSKSLVGIPIIRADRVLGMLVIENFESENAFREAEVRFLTAIVSALGAALENARLFDETQRLLKETEQRAAELATVNTVSSAITGELKLDALIQLVGEQVRSVFRTDITYVALLDKNTNNISFPYQYGQYLEPLQLGQGLTSRVMQSGAPLLINEDLQRQREQMGATQLGKRALSYLGVPIFAGGEPIGVISVQSTTEEGVFQENDQHLLSTIAANVGIALQNARLFDEIKHQEQVARESAEKLRLIFENAFDGIDVYEEIPATGQRILVECNDRYCELAGRSREELMSVENTSVFQRDVLNPWAETGREAVLRGEAFRGVFSWIRPDGRENVIEYNAAPTRVGDRYFTIGLDRDVTERMRVENELRESNEKLRLIFENAFDGISIYEEIPEESRRVLLDCNDRYCEMAGRSKEELVSLHDTRTIQRDLGVGSDAFGFEPIKEGRAFSGVFSWVRPDGRENIIEYNAAPTRVGNRYFTIGLDRDVTERRHYEKELEKARSAAEQANQAKSAFLANMSHELRTPLNAIIGFTRIVRRKAEGVLPEKQTENLDKVLTSADHLLNLINTVLDIAKIEAGRMDVLAANFRIAALVDLCANTVQPLLKPTVVLEKQVEEGLTYVYSDQDKIRQIVLNLLSNAAKFTHEGKIILSARQDGKHLHIAVSDTGIGISAEALPRIFKEFQQADNTTTRQYGGTGLGLSISRNLAHLLGGDLTVESELGKGSTFTLVLPIRYESKLAASRADRENTSVQETAARTETRFTKKHILVIDDDPDAVYLLQENLNPQEYEVLGALNGPDGLEMARKKQPDAILLDVVMPGADGWHVLHDLKADQVTSHIPVVFLSIMDKKALGLQLGAAAYLLKPLDPEKVKDTLNRVIGETARPKNILVVDDDPNIADMLRQSLPESDFHLESAADGIAGLECIDAHRPDILLLDLLMPRLDGFGVIEKLRADPKTSSLPIVVLSAKDLTADESARLKETVAVVMKKQGFEGTRLVSEISQLLALPGKNLQE